MAGVKSRTTRLYRLSSVVLAAAALGLTGCVVNPHPAVNGSERTVSARLYGKPLELHLSAPAQTTSGKPLVLYVSGDGGWFGAAVDMFRVIADAGYNAVGFSARTFLRLDRPNGRVASPEQLAVEYQEILGTSREVLHLPVETPVILSGWSRGAAFAVLVGTAPKVPMHLQGVVAIGLTDGEDLQVSDSDDSDDVTPASRHASFQPYARIAQLGSVRCAVIQASGDHFLPASHARELFGPDTLFRRLYAITAKNHRFSGGKDAFDQALVDALHWIAS
jgi:hypothetical protein